MIYALCFVMGFGFGCAYCIVLQRWAENLPSKVTAAPTKHRTWAEVKAELDRQENSVE